METQEYTSSSYESPPPQAGKTSPLTLWQDVLFSPSVQTFKKYRREADLGRAVLWLVIAFTLSGLISAVTSLLNVGTSRQFMQMLRQNLPPEVTRELPPMVMPGTGVTLGSALCGIPTTIILGLIGAFIGIGLIYLAARLLKGAGTFTTTFFLMACASVPLTIVNSVLQLLMGLLGLIPVVGVISGILLGIVGFALGIYGLVLAAMAIAAAHEFSLGKGFAAVLLPAVVIFLLICCCSIVGLSLLGASLEQLFREIQREMGTVLTWTI